MLEIMILLAVAFVICSALVVFSCTCWFRSRGFSNFENGIDSDSPADPYFEVYTTGEVSPNSYDTSLVTFDPLPDILAKRVTATALRPRISHLNRQENILKVIAAQRSFPRKQLIYVKEMGIGWFGQVLQGDAEKILVGVRCSKVIVKVLRDDCSVLEQQVFLEEIAVYREVNKLVIPKRKVYQNIHLSSIFVCGIACSCVLIMELDHPNIVSLLGQCTETLPLLVILEYFPYGDLKNYLLGHKNNVDIFNQRRLVLRFAMDMASGLACMHRHNYIHHDFSTRNCLVSTNLTIKIGDYGLGENQFKEDYYDTGCDLLPVRWLAPETLDLKDGVWHITNFTKQANLWAYGVAAWELMEFGKQPYRWLTDEQVLERVIRQRSEYLPLPRSFPVAKKQQMYEVMEHCWQDANQRPNIEEIHDLLQQLEKSMQTVEEAEFDRWWDEVNPNNASIHIATDVLEAIDSSSKWVTSPDPWAERKSEGSNMDQLSKFPTLSDNNSCLKVGEDFIPGESETRLQETDMVGAGGKLNSVHMPSSLLDSNSVSSDEIMENHHSLDVESNGEKHIGTSASVISAGAELVNMCTPVSGEYQDNLELTGSVQCKQLPISDQVLDQASVSSHSKDGECSSPEFSLEMADFYLQKQSPSFRRARLKHTQLAPIPENSMPLEEEFTDDSFRGSFDEGPSLPDSYEWDELLGGELIGKVKEGDFCPRHTMDLSDWCFEPNDSSQDSSNSSHHSSRSASQASSLTSDISTPSEEHLTTVSEVKLSENAWSFASQILTQRVVASYCNKTPTRRMFYTLSSSMDIDDDISEEDISLSDTYRNPFSSTPTNPFSQDIARSLVGSPLQQDVGEKAISGLQQKNGGPLSNRAEPTMES